MKSNKMAKKVAASVLTGSMVFSMGGMTAFAATLGTDITEIGITKNVKTDKENKTYAPNTSFTFTVTPGDSEESLIYQTATGTATTNVLRGLEGGLKFETGENAASFDSSMVADAEGVYTVTGEDAPKLTVDDEVFTKAGVYHYKVEETPGTYAGVDYDDNFYDVYVFVEFNTAGTKTCTFIAYKNDGSGKANEKASALVFDNDYGANAELNSTHDVTITKKITGNQSRDDDEFKITVSIEADVEGEKFAVVATKDGVEQPSVDIIDGGSAEFSVYAEDTIHVYGLTAGDKVTVNETYKGSGYTNTYETLDGVIKDENVTDKLAFTVSADNADVTVTNDKTVSTPTGIAMTFAPYALMVAAAGGFGALFLRGKKREDF